MDFTIGIVYRNLVTKMNFVEFRDSRNFSFFEAGRGVRDTWHFMSGSRYSTCPGKKGSNMSSSGAMSDKWHLVSGWKSKLDG